VTIAVLPVPFYNGSGCQELAPPGGITEPQQPYTWLTDDSPMLAYTPDNIAVPPESDSEAIWQNPLPPFPQNSPSQTSTASSLEGNLSQRQTTGCEPTPISLDTARIINMQCLSKYVQDITFHAVTCESCVDMAHAGHPAIVLEGELHRDGLASILCARCKGCNDILHLETSRKIAGRGGRQRWEVNLAGVWGQMSTGGGHNTLAESMAVLGIPVMSK